MQRCLRQRSASAAIGCVGRSSCAAHNDADDSNDRQHESRRGGPLLPWAL
eukprot:COSAG06_NODE_20089_length_809_cov_1.288732_1_plen_49_part_10